MSAQRPRPLRGWGEVDADRVGWRRNRDWIGRHTIIAVILGGAFAALIGILATNFIAPLSTSPQGRIAEIEREARGAAFAEAWEGALAAAVIDARIVALADLLAEDAQGADAPWATGFRDGWAHGWNEALDAMRDASLDSGARPGSPEVKMLDDVPRRTGSPP